MINTLGVRVQITRPLLVCTKLLFVQEMDMGNTLAWSLDELWRRSSSREINDIYYIVYMTKARALLRKVEIYFGR